MRKKLVSAVAALLILATTLPSIANAQGYRGGGYGYRGGYGRGYGHYYGGRGYYFPGAFVGLGYGYYGYGGGYYAPDYYGVPPVVGYALTAPAEGPAAIWYYCPPARAYYPYVQECPVAWQAVPAQQQPPQPADHRPSPVADVPDGKKSFNLGDVLFDTGKATLLPSATWALDQLVDAAEKSPEARIRIEGYTDNLGEGRSNLQLSQRRADAVKFYLLSHGIERKRMEAIGHGDAAPVASNSTAEGRQQNRRVDVTLG